ncbi:MAG: hypothetical protein OXT67_00880 [Zetaproteobacteria bacterium]|nr:hypothetical protein [Zetaproteobacteria bacterium]
MGQTTQPHKPNSDPTHALTSLSLEEIVQLTNKAGVEYTEAKQQADRLELLKPTQKALAMDRADDGEISEARIKRKAEIDPEYVAYLEQLAAAKARADRQRIRYDSFKNLFDARRSTLSYKKAEMKLF